MKRCLLPVSPSPRSFPGTYISSIFSVCRHLSGQKRSTKEDKLPTLAEIEFVFDMEFVKIKLEERAVTGTVKQKAEKHAWKEYSDSLFYR